MHLNIWQIHFHDYLSHSIMDRDFCLWQHKILESWNIIGALHQGHMLEWLVRREYRFQRYIPACDPSLEKLHGKPHAGSSQSGSSHPGTLDCQGCRPGTLHRNVPPSSSGIMSSVLCAWAANTALARPSYVPSREKLSSPPHFFPKELSFQMPL